MRVRGTNCISAALERQLRAVVIDTIAFTQWFMSALASNQL